MRRQQDAFGGNGQERIFGAPVVRKAVERRAAYPPFREDTGQIRFHHHTAPGRVDQQGMGLHGRKQVVIHKVAGTAVERAMQGNHVALGEQLRHIHTLDPVFSRELFRPEGVASGHGTPKSLGERDDRAPDIAEPEQPDPASAQLKAALLQKFGTRSRIASAADFPVGPCEAALEVHNGGHHVFRDRGRVHVRRIRYRNTELRRREVVNGIKARARGLDEADGRHPFEAEGVHIRLGRREQKRLRALCRRDQDVAAVGRQKMQRKGFRKGHTGFRKPGTGEQAEDLHGVLLFAS